MVFYTIFIRTLVVVVVIVVVVVVVDDVVIIVVVVVVSLMLECVTRAMSWDWIRSRR